MKKVSKWLSLLIAIIMVASVGLVGCGTAKEQKPADQAQQPAAPAAPKDVQELNLMTSDEPLLDPQAGQYSYEFAIMNNIYEGLLRMNANKEYEPALAESYTTSPDGLVWTFKIRQNANWSDGTPITAQDFVFGLKRATSEQLASIYAFIVSDYVKDAKAIDDKTLEITLLKPVPYFESLLVFATYFPAKEEFVKAAGESYGKEVDKMLYSGPFKVVEWVHDQKLVLAKNENYWDKDNVKLEKITLNIVKDSNAALSLYEAGDVDRTRLVKEQLALYKDSPEFKIEPDPVTYYIVLNTKNKVLTNANIRKALSYGFDRQSYVDVVLQNGSTPATGLVPPGMPGPEGKTFREANGDLVTYDEAKAKEFLAAGLKELGLDKLPALRYIDYDSDVAIKGAEFVKENYRKLGIEITIENLPVATVKEKRKAGDFDLFFGGWGPDYWDPMTFMDLFVTNGPFNEGKWSNKDYDAAIDFGKNTSDFKTRMEKLLAAEKLLIQDEAGIVPVYYRSIASLTKPYVKNYTTYQFGADVCWKWTYIEGKAK